MQPDARSTESRSDKTDSDWQLSHDELDFEMQHTKAPSHEPSIPPSISANPSSVVGPIDLNDEATGGSQKVDDVFAEHDLPAKRDPELTARKPSPEPVFGERGLSTHDASAFVE
jgi:hypothetical protein